MFPPCLPCPLRPSTTGWSASALLRRTSLCSLTPAPPTSGSPPFTAPSSMWPAVSWFPPKKIKWQIYDDSVAFSFNSATHSEGCQKSVNWLDLIRLFSTPHWLWALWEKLSSDWASAVFRGSSQIQLEEVQHLRSERHQVLHPVRQRQLVWFHQRGHRLSESHSRLNTVFL